MNVKLLKSGKTAKLSTSYALRLIEQGKAIPAPVTAKKQGKKDTGTPAKGGEANVAEG